MIDDHSMVRDGSMMQNIYEYGCGHYMSLLPMVIIPCHLNDSSSSRSSSSSSTTTTTSSSSE